MVGTSISATVPATIAALTLVPKAWKLVTRAWLCRPLLQVPKHYRHREMVSAGGGNIGVVAATFRVISSGFCRWGL